MRLTICSYVQNSASPFHHSSSPSWVGWLAEGILFGAELPVWGWIQTCLKTKNWRWPRKIQACFARIPNNGSDLTPGLALVSKTHNKILKGNPDVHVKPLPHGLEAIPMTWPHIQFCYSHQSVPVVTHFNYGREYLPWQTNSCSREIDVGVASWLNAPIVSRVWQTWWCAK